MPYTSPFSNRRKPISVSGAGAKQDSQLDLGGLDLATPYDAMKKNRSPFARNFRIYAEESDDRRVAVSNRKGSGSYVVPVGETLNAQNTDLTGTNDALLGVSSEWKAMPFTPTVSGKLTKLELTVKNALNARGPILVKIYSNNGGVPGTLLADTGITADLITDTYGSRAANLIEAPAVVSGTQYWIVSNIQDDGEGAYYWRKTTGTALALTSNTSGLSWETTNYSLNFKTYITPATEVYGTTRYTPATGTNRTLLAVGTAMKYVTDNTGATTDIVTGLSASASQYHFDMMDNKVFWVNGYDTLRSWNGTTHEAITHTQLPILKLMCVHANRIFGVSADDPNKLVYSEDPGNDDGAGNEWYKAWLSTSFIYVPAPKANDPITAIVPFQGNLVIFTTTGKYILYGTDPGSFSLRPATGEKGAVSQNGVYADENFIYFVSTDGLYRYNGSSDEIISDNVKGEHGSVQPEFDRIADPARVSIAKWKRGIRFYYPVSGSSVNNRTLIWHTVFEEWLLDTDSYVKYAVPWTDGDDPKYLVEVSSVAPTAHYAEMADNNLGKQIDFLYYCRPDSMGNPAQRKRISKFFPLLEGEGGDYPVELAVDKDRQDDAAYTKLDLTTEGAEIGDFVIGDGTVVGGRTSFKPVRVRVSGYACYWQVRVKRKAIDNPVNFIGYVWTYRGKRL